MSQSKRLSTASGPVRDAANARGSATTAEGIAGERALLAARGRGRETSWVTRAARADKRAG